MELTQMLAGNSLVKRMAINMIIAAIDGKLPGGRVAITEVASAISDLIDEALQLADKNRNGKIEVEEVAKFIDHIEAKLPMLLEYISSKILILIRSRLLSTSTVTIKPTSL